MTVAEGLRRPCGCTIDPLVFGHSAEEHQHAMWLAELQASIRKFSTWTAGMQLEYLRAVASQIETETPFCCPRCGWVSHNSNDIQQGYCGLCHDWTGLGSPGRDAAQGEVTGAGVQRDPHLVLAAPVGVGDGDSVAAGEHLELDLPPAVPVLGRGDGELYADDPDLIGGRALPAEQLRRHSLGPFRWFIPLEFRRRR